VFAKARDGNIYSWGYNSTGQLGHGDTISRSTPTKLPEDFLKFSEICCAGYHTLALDSDGGLWQWGGGHGDKLNPKKIEISEFFVAIAGGLHHSLALTKNGEVFTWGSNNSSQLGHEDSDGSEAFPRKLIFPEPEHVVCIIAGCYHCTCVTVDGKCYTWGMKTTLGRPLVLGRKKIPIPGFQADFPGGDQKWMIARWLLLGRSGEDSDFFGIPLEIVYNLISVMDSDFFFLVSRGL
jgi:hypothetical protein